MHGYSVEKTSQAGTEIKNAIAFIQRQGNAIVKLFHANNAKEETSKSLSSFFQQKGTVQTQKALHSLPANGTIERRFFTTLSEVGAGTKRSVLPLKFWTYTCWKAMNKSNSLPFFRNGKLMKSPHATLK